MSCRSWDTVVIHWINAISINGYQTKRIGELENGIFFNYILELINPNQNESYELLPKQDPERLVMFLMAEYPNYGPLSCDYSADNMELMLLSSLLLFHCTIKINISCLKDKMCNNLDQYDQLIIKTFLENIALSHKTQITRFVLKKCIIENNFDHGFKFGSRPKLPTVTLFENNPELSRDRLPLKDFLQSPIAQQQELLNKRTLEAKRLVSGLEVEMLEKINLQEKLKVQTEKSKKLELQLHKKTREIKKLCEDWMDASPAISNPHYSEVHVRKLQEKMHCLENQITLMQTEVINLQRERNSSMLKVSNVERMCTMWASKSTQLQESCQSLQKELGVKEEQLSSLREYCVELETVMSKSNSAEDTSSSSLSPLRYSVNEENLSHLLKELRFQELQEENTILKDRISDLMKREEMVALHIQELKPEPRSAHYDCSTKRTAVDMCSGVVLDQVKRLHFQPFHLAAPPDNVEYFQQFSLLLNGNHIVEERGQNQSKIEAYELSVINATKQAKHVSNDELQIQETQFNTPTNPRIKIQEIHQYTNERHSEDNNKIRLLNCESVLLSITDHLLLLQSLVVQINPEIKLLLEELKIAKVRIAELLSKGEDLSNTMCDLKCKYDLEITAKTELTSKIQALEQENIEVNKALQGARSEVLLAKDSKCVLLDVLSMGIVEKRRIIDILANEVAFLKNKSTNFSDDINSYSFCNTVT